MTNQVIKDRVLRTEKLNWRNLKPFQPEDLKFMSQESFEILKNSIKKKDFVASITVWQEGTIYWILDGHHRVKALEELESEGNTVPELLSCEIIDCKNEQEANDILLTYSSNHARLDEKGLKEFITNNDLNIEELKATLDLNINFDALFGEIVAHNDANAEWNGMPEFKQDNKEAFKTLTINFACQEDVDGFAELMGQTITEKTRFIWFPKVERDVLCDKRYATQNA